MKPVIDQFKTRNSVEIIHASFNMKIMLAIQRVRHLLIVDINFYTQINVPVWSLWLVHVNFMIQCLRSYPHKCTDVCLMMGTYCRSRPSVGRPIMHKWCGFKLLRWCAGVRANKQTALATATTARDSRFCGPPHVFFFQTRCTVIKHVHVPCFNGI